MNMLPETSHSIGEKVLLVSDAAEQGELTVRIMRMKDGLYFNYTAARFEQMPVGGPEDDFEREMTPVFNSGVVALELATLPEQAGRFLVEIHSQDGSVDHRVLVFGGPESSTEPDTCRVYGRVLDIGGQPVSGQRVEVLLSTGGYFPHKSGLISTSRYALTDHSGYFEVNLICGLDVTISIPSIGFTQRGIVPFANSVEIKGLLPRT